MDNINHLCVGNRGGVVTTELQCDQNGHGRRNVVAYRANSWGRSGISDLDRNFAPARPYAGEMGELLELRIEHVIRDFRTRDNDS